MAFLLLAQWIRSPPASRAQSDLVVEHDIVTDDGSLTDYNARAMVDEKAFPYLRARMDLDASRYHTSELRDQAWNEGHVRFVERVGDAVEENGPEPLVE